MTVSSPLQRLEGKYEIIEKMSEGGMGAIYKVRHRLLDEVRVVKVMRPHLAEDEVLRARFMREAKVAIRLKHQNIAQVYDFTMDEEGYFFLVMEYIDGVDLFSVIRSQRLVPLGVAVEIAQQSLGVLGYLHRKEIVHRDISPDNILLSRDDDGALLVKLIDLGIAKVQQADEHLTATGTFLGKVRYSSPEQFRSEGGSAIGPRSDLYSLGIVLYEMLTGKYPIQGKNISSLISGHLMHPPLPFEESDPDGRVPEELRTVVVRALCKEPDERFPSARTFRTKILEMREAYPVDHKEVESLFDMPQQPTSKIRVKKPGSTQGHLDRNFGVETTPTHTAPTVFESDGGGGGQTDVPGETAEHVKALFLGAEKLVRGGHIDEARLQVEAIRAMAPDDPGLPGLVEILEKSDTRLQARRGEAVRQVKELVETGFFDEARSALETAVERLGQATCFSDLEGFIAEAEAEAEAKKAHLEGILESVRGLLAREEWEDAAPMAREALILDPESKDAAALLAQAEAGAEEAKRAERRRREIEKAERTVEGHLEKEDPTAARKALEVATKVYGVEPSFEQLGDRIEALEAELLLRRVQALLGEAGDQLEAGDFEAAVGTLEEVSGLAPDDDEVKARLAEARDRLEAQREARRRDEAIARAVAEVGRLIMVGRLESASRSLAEAVEEFGDFDEAAQLQERVAEETAGREERERAVGEKIRKAEDQGRKKKFERARAELDEALTLAGEDPVLLGEIDLKGREIDSLARRHRRCLDVEAAATSVADHIDKGELSEAERELKLAERLYGGEEVFAGLRARIDQVRRRAGADELIEKAGAEEGDIDTAIALLEDAVAMVPDDQEVLDRLEGMRAEKIRRGDELRSAAIAEALEPIDVLISEGDFKAALAALKKAVGALGEWPEARRLVLLLGRAVENKGR